MSRKISAARAPAAISAPAGANRLSIFGGLILCSFALSAMPSVIPRQPPMKENSAASIRSSDAQPYRGHTLLDSSAVNKPLDSANASTAPNKTPVKTGASFIPRLFARTASQAVPSASDASKIGRAHV